MNGEMDLGFFFKKNEYTNKIYSIKVYIKRYFGRLVFHAIKSGPSKLEIQCCSMSPVHFNNSWFYYSYLENEYSLLGLQPGVPNRGPSAPLGATGIKSNFGGPWEIERGPQHNM